MRSDINFPARSSEAVFPGGSPPSFPTTAPSLGEDAVDHLTEDCVSLMRFFKHHGDYIGLMSVAAINLNFHPQTLCRLGVLKPKRLGRWDDGWCAGPALSDA